MILKNHTRIDLAQGGNIFKQGDYVDLAFTPRDAAGKVVDLTGKQIEVAIWNSKKGVIYQDAASWDATDKVIRMKIEQALDHGKFQIEFTVTDSTDSEYRMKFPSDEYNGVISITPSTDDIGYVGANVITVTQLRDEQTQLQRAFESDIVPRVEELQQRVEDGVGAFTEDTEVLDARMGEPNLRAFNQKLTTQLAETATGVGVNINQFKRIIPEVDDMPRFQRAVDHLKSVGGGRLVVPKTDTPYQFQFKTSSTVFNPTRVLVTGDGIEIVGIGKPVIEMKGLTIEYLFSIDDYASSGRDIFTAFSFAGVSNCKISDFIFIGEYTGTQEFRYQSPRSIAVAFKGATDCEATDLYGKDILGNVVNVVSSTNPYDAPFSWSTNVNLHRCQAVHCLENGFNYMGATRIGTVSDLYATGCANGIESHCEFFVMNNVVFTENRSSGFALSGKNQIVNGAIASGTIRYDSQGVADPLTGFGCVLTEGDGIQINGGKFNDNNVHAIFVYPGVKNVQFTNPEIKRNAKNATYKTAIQMTGSASKRIQNITFLGGEIEAEGAVTGSIVNYADDVKIINMKGTFEDASSAFSFASECNGTYVAHNRFNKPVSMSDPTGESYNNGAYRIIDSNSLPTTGTFTSGDVINRPSRAIGSIAEWSVISSGTLGTLNGGNTTGSITVGTKELTVNSTAGIYKGCYLAIAGLAGVKRVRSIAGNVVTLDNNAEATVSVVSVAYRPPFIIVSRQNGVATSVASAPAAVGFTAVVGSTIYQAKGTSSAADWVQVS